MIGGDNHYKLNYYHQKFAKTLKKDECKLRLTGETKNKKFSEMMSIRSDKSDESANLTSLKTNLSTKVKTSCNQNRGLKIL